MRAPGGKQLAVVAGHPVLWWTLRAVAASPHLSEIVVVSHPDRVGEYVDAAIAPLGLGERVRVVPGGNTRQDSVAQGLRAVSADSEFVVVQDGARPLLTPQMIADVLEPLIADAGWAGAVVGYPAVDTLKLVEGAQAVATPDRSQYWAVQTPQAFRAEALHSAYAAAAAEGFVGTDDASLVERVGGRVTLVQGPRDNLKVTVPEDLLFVEAALRFREGG